MTQWRPSAGLNRRPADPLSAVLAQPRLLAGLDLAGWDVVVRRARETALLGAVAHLARESVGWDAVPERPRRHLSGARRVARGNALALAWELECLEEPLSRLDAAPVLLKGAAYVAAGLPNAAGRIANDVDLLFPRDRLPRVESLLGWKGWVSSHLDAYDQRYYRRWMHELPPMRHARRGSTLDIHHNIVPETFAVHPDPARLLEQAVPVPGWPAYRVLCPAHMVLHAAAHLFSETEWDLALRDLYDIHCLAGCFAARDGEQFWLHLLEEAEALDLGRLLFYALRHAARRFATSVPDEAAARLRLAGPGPLRLAVLDAAFDGGFRPRAASSTGGRDAVARGVLFLRGHWLKMPPWLLARHLFHKAILARTKDRDGE